MTVSGRWPALSPAREPNVSSPSRLVISGVPSVRPAAPTLLTSSAHTAFLAETRNTDLLAYSARFNERFRTGFYESTLPHGARRGNCPVGVGVPVPQKNLEKAHMTAKKITPIIIFRKNAAFSS